MIATARSTLKTIGMDSSYIRINQEDPLYLIRQSDLAFTQSDPQWLTTSVNRHLSKEVNVLSI
jgi:hypothetical protein